MITPEQQKWINHLSDKTKIKILPFDPTSEEKFQKIKALIQSRLGKEIPVRHRGSSNLGISGQDEIDVYIPIDPEVFDYLIPPLTKLFGEPKSHYPLERARFKTFEDKKHIDIFLINKKCTDWLNSVKFESHLKTNPKTLVKYEKLKKSCNDLSTREYYKIKTEFINEILKI